MRFCTWNMNRQAPSRCWPIVRDKIDADVAFVQEAPEPKNLPPDRVIWKEIGANSRFGEKGRYYWATGIYSKETELRHIAAGELGDGWVVAAETPSSHGLRTPSLTGDGESRSIVESSIRSSLSACSTATICFQKVRGHSGSMRTQSRMIISMSPRLLRKGSRATSLTTTTLIR